MLFILILPYLIEQIASSYTDYYLQQQQNKVLKVVSKNGVDSYLQGEESYGSYTMLKEEYISLEPVETGFKLDTIYTDQRIIEQDTLNYRVLIHAFDTERGTFLMEVGKTIETIDQYKRPLQRIATYVLLGLILITLIIDLFYTRFLLHPLLKIIQTKIINRKFPFSENPIPVKTSTADFRFLDDSLIHLMNQINVAFQKEREFTANASHELMTPIGILQNKIENLMDEPGISDLVQERLMGMQKTLNRLKRIVHSLLLISRIENDQFTKNDSVSVDELISDILDEISHRLSEKYISLDLSISKDIKLQNINRDLIFQMIYNLLNNAIRYNKVSGFIKIQDRLNVDGTYQIDLIDGGVGIPRDEIGSIFNRFKKVNKSEDSLGYGLGLSIVKSIAEYHQITISVDSEVDKGSTFTLLFPKFLIRK